MDDIRYTDKPRWHDHLGLLGALDRDCIAHIGAYDVRLRRSGGTGYVVVAECPRGDRLHAYTSYMLRDNVLEPVDDDVVLDPYHMGLLYRVHYHQTGGGETLAS